MRTLLLMASVLAFVVLGCQTKTKTAKGPEPAPVAETADLAEPDAPANESADPWSSTTSDDTESTDESTVAETTEEEAEPEPVYDEYGGGGEEEPPPDEEYSDYDDSEG